MDMTMNMDMDIETKMLGCLTSWALVWEQSYAFSTSDRTATQQMLPRCTDWGI